VDKKSSSLNLVQRAMNLGFDRAPLAQPLMPADTVSSRLADDLLVETMRRAEDRGPILREAAPAADLRLNYARFRDDKIICPGNVDIATHNEFRTVKRRLLLAMQEAKPREGRPSTLLVTSTLPGEGKTFTALNLAAVLAAERNMHVLLIDGDAIKPSLPGYFTGAADTPGLTDVLDGSARTMEAIHACADIDNLSVMFAGSANPRASELMASARMEEMLAELARAYPDLFVVIDCSPVLSPEPAALAPHVDHAVMVIAAQQTSRHQLRDALEHLAACSHVSLLFNKSPRWRRDGRYYGYYAPPQSSFPNPEEARNYAGPGVP